MPRYPAYQFSAGQWPQQLYYGPQYWGYPPYVPHGGATPAGNFYPQLGFPSPGRQRERRRSQTPPPDVIVHQLLGGRYKPMCWWDISLYPSTARQMTPRGTLDPIPAVDLDSPATEPHAHFMKIVCDLFPWPISITVSRNETISVGHVLEAIYAELQIPLEEEEWEEETNNNRKKMHKAMCARLSHGPPALKLAGHVKKIDYLGDKTHFLGLKPVGPADAPEEWLLKLGYPPKKESRR